MHGVQGTDGLRWCQRNGIPHAPGGFTEDLQRLVDEGAFPAALVRRDDSRRSFSRLSAAFARFFYETAGHLTKQHRVDVIAQLTARLMERDDSAEALSLTGTLVAFNWSVQFPLGSLTIEPVVLEAQARARRLLRLASTIVEDPGILSGTPVFHGTRVPIASIVESKAAGVDFNRLVASYPFLTPDLVDDAEVYLTVHPRRGRPRKLGGTDSLNASWKRASAKVVRAGSGR